MTQPIRHVSAAIISVIVIVTLPLMSHLRGCLALQGRRAPADNVVRSLNSQLFRAMFFGVVTAAIAVVRIKHRLAKRLKVEIDEIAGGKNGTTLTSACIPRPCCSGWSCTNASLNGPALGPDVV